MLSRLMWGCWWALRVKLVMGFGFAGGRFLDQPRIGAGRRLEGGFVSIATQYLSDGTVSLAVGTCEAGFDVSHEITPT